MTLYWVEIIGMYEKGKQMYPLHGCNVHSAAGGISHKVTKDIREDYI